MCLLILFIKIIIAFDIMIYVLSILRSILYFTYTQKERIHEKVWGIIVQCTVLPGIYLQ